MNIHKGGSGGSIPGRMPLYFCHIPLAERTGFHVFSSVTPIIPRVSVSSVYRYGPLSSTLSGEFTVPERSKKRMVTPAR